MILRYKIIRIGLIVVTIFLILLHGFKPHIFVIDSVTCVLIALLASLFFFPYLKKLKLMDLELEFDKILNSAEKKSEKLEFQISEVKELKKPIEIKGIQDINYFYDLIEIDPNVALAGIRIEIEKALKKVAEDIRLEKSVYDHRPPLILATILQEKGGITRNQLSLLKDILTLCNKAVHGYEVTKENATKIINLAEALLQDYLRWRAMYDK